MFQLFEAELFPFSADLPRKQKGTNTTSIERYSGRVRSISSRSEPRESNEIARNMQLRHTSTIPD